MGLATPKMGITIPENRDDYPCFWALKKLKEKRNGREQRVTETTAQRIAQRGVGKTFSMVLDRGCS
jgi:hypothetical protein